MTIPVIIEVALNGATTKARNPNVPCDPNELIADAVACIDAGATIVHTHIEDVKITGEIAANRYAEAYREIRVARPDALLYPTVVLNDDQATKFAHVAHLAEEGLIDMIAFDPGSTNIALGLDPDGLPIAEILYENSFSDIRYAFDLFGKLGVGPSLAIYEPSFLRATLAWRAAGRLPRGTFVKFYFGGEYDFATGQRGTVGIGFNPTELALEAYLEMFNGADLPWAAAVPGGCVVESGMATFALERGGHLRVGLEDYGGDGAPSNVELVKQAVASIETAGRSVAEPSQTLAILDLERR